MSMRMMGVDFGMARTGVALGDTETGMAFPLSVLEEADVNRLAVRVLEIAAAEGAERIVVGCPVRLTGHVETGETERAVHDFVSRLRAAGTLPVDLEDERMSTAYAEKMKREAGSASKMGADAIAAAAILETYLMRMRP